MPSKDDFEKNRFYQCVLTHNGFNCEQIFVPDYIIKENSVLVSIDNYVPKIKFIEKMLIKQALKPKNIIII
jgi:hypothetical protein